jgi:hypothetical protein
VLTEILSVGVLVFVGVRLVGAARLATSQRGSRTVRYLLAGVRWRHVWPAPLVLTAVAVAATMLLQVPGLDWGWWTALGGEGNPVTGTTETTSGSVWEWLVPLVFVLLLAPALPLFALAEERIFRRGAESWTASKRIARTVGFGLVHAVIGIPLGVAVALVLAGGYFLGVYLRTWRRTRHAADALVESTRAHTVYNAVILVLVLVYAVAVALD